MDMFIEWWTHLDAMSQIFLCIAVPATLVLVIQTVSMFLGIGEGDGDTDGIADLSEEAPDGVFGEDSVSEPADVSGLEGLRIFTVRGIIAFLVVFGWLGMVMQELGAHIAVTLTVATVGGFVMMLVLAILFRSILKLRSDGNLDNRNAVGVAGKVYLTIPPARSGSGKVQVMLQGVCVERNAVTDSHEAIPTGAEIVVVCVSGQVDLVVKRK